MTSEEEQEKRRRRAEKFGISVYNAREALEGVDDVLFPRVFPLIGLCSQEELERREQRKQKYGVETTVDKTMFVDEEAHELEKEDVTAKVCFCVACCGVLVFVGTFVVARLI